MKLYGYPKNKYCLLDFANQYKPLNFVLEQIFDFNNTFFLCNLKNLHFVGYGITINIPYQI